MPNPTRADPFSGTIVCPSCGAAVKKTAAACTYCGAEVVLPKPVGAVGPAERRTFCTRCGQTYPAAAARCPRCPPASSDEPAAGQCPRCAGAFETTSMGVGAGSAHSVTVDRCRSCHGLWFDGDEVEHAIDVTTKGMSREEASSLRPSLPASSMPVEPVRYVACVRCGELMARRQVAPRAGIIVDVCRMHGVWFDGGEFEKFEAFVRAGGLELARHDALAAEDARERFAREARAEVQAGPLLTSPLWTAPLGARSRPSSTLVWLASLLGLD